MQTPGLGLAANEKGATTKGRKPPLRFLRHRPWPIDRVEAACQAQLDRRRLRPSLLAVPPLPWPNDTNAPAPVKDGLTRDLPRDLNGPDPRPMIWSRSPKPLPITSSCAFCALSRPLSSATPEPQHFFPPILASWASWRFDPIPRLLRLMADH